jgi:hypothetical protein
MKVMMFQEGRMGIIKKLAPAIILCLLLCSCDSDPYRGQRPIEYPKTQWICEDYDISFSVGEKYELLDPKMLINEEEVPFTFLWSGFDNSVNINFKIKEKPDSLSGECKFGKEEFTITIGDTKGYYLDEQIILKFVRTSLEPET